MERPDPIDGGRIARAALHALLSAVPGLRGADIVDHLRRSRELAAEELVEFDAHPAFAAIIGQLDAEEAQCLRH